MTIQFKCSACAAPLQAPEELAGRKGKCRQCGVSIVVPNPAADRWPPGMAPPTVATNQSPRPAAPRPAPAKTSSAPTPKPAVPQALPVAPKVTGDAPRKASAVPPAVPVAPVQAAKVHETLTDGLPMAAPVDGPLPQAQRVGETPADVHEENPFGDLAAMLDLEASAPAIQMSSPADVAPSAPSTDDAPKPRVKRGTSLGVGAILSDSWQIYKANWMLCTGTLILAGAINGIASVAVVVGAWAYVMVTAGTLLVLGVLAFWPLLIVIPAWLIAGICLFSLNVARGKKADLANLFEGSPFIRSLLGLLFVQSACYGILGAVSNYLDAPWIAFLNVIPSVLLIQAPFAIVHQEYDAVAAIAESIQLTLSNIGPLLLIWATMAAIWCLTVIPTCGLGLIFAGPFMMVMTTVTYLAIERRSRR